MFVFMNVWYQSASTIFLLAGSVPVAFFLVRVRKFFDHTTLLLFNVSHWLGVYEKFCRESFGQAFS
jgi:hypothetical protein